MSDLPTTPISQLRERLADLQQFSGTLNTILKQAFMAAPPMPAPQGMPPPGMGGGMPIDPNTGMPMDPAMMQGMPPPGMGGGMPVDPNTGMPMDPAMMQGMMQGMPPPGMGGGIPIDPNTGMPMDPAMMQQGGVAPPPQGGGIPPEIMEELFGIVEELARRAQDAEGRMAKMEEALQEVMATCQDLESALQSAASAPPAPNWR